jgi:hypothetical protein
MVSPSHVAMISFSAMRRRRFLCSGELCGSSQSLGRSRAKLQMGRTFAASPVRYSLRPAKLLATLADLTGYFSQPTVAFTSRLSTGRSPFLPLDITTVATEQVPPGRDRAEARALCHKTKSRFPGPPCNPGRSDFPIPVLALAFPERPF